MSEEWKYDSLRDLAEEALKLEGRTGLRFHSDILGWGYNQEHPNEKVTAFHNRILEIARLWFMKGWFESAPLLDICHLPMPPDEDAINYTRQGQIISILKETVFFDHSRQVWLQFKELGECLRKKAEKYKEISPIRMTFDTSKEGTLDTSKKSSQIETQSDYVVRIKTYYICGEKKDE